MSPFSSPFKTFIVGFLALLAGLVTHAWAQPNLRHVVEQCRLDYPAAWSAAHRGGPDSDDFIILCARDLQKVDPNFGVNGKRGNPRDLSDDSIAYRGAGIAVDIVNGGPMSIIDICVSCGGAKPSVGWGVGLGGPGDKGVWVDPFSVSPHVRPANLDTPVPSPPQPTQPGQDPTLAVLLSIESLLRAQVEAQQYTNQRLAALEEFIGTDPSPEALKSIDAVLKLMLESKPPIYVGRTWFGSVTLRPQD